MRNPVLAVAIAFVVAAPCTALAQNPSLNFQKIEHEYKPQKDDGTLGAAPADNKKSSPTLYKNAAAKGSHIPEVTIEMRKTQQTNKPLSTTANPALQGNAFQKGTLGGTGATKPPLPTTGGMQRQ